MSVHNTQRIINWFRLTVFGIIMFVSAGTLAADEVGDTRVFWAHNFQFFAYDYRLGATLQEVSEHAYYYVENAIVLSSVVDETNGTIYIGTAHGGVFKRAFTATVWTNISTGLPGDAIRGGYSAVNALVLKSDGGLIAGTDEGLYSRNQGATTWRSRGVSIPIFDMVIDGDSVYAATGHYLWDVDDDDDGDIDVNMGVRFSNNGGETWVELSAGLPKDNDDETIEVSALAKSGTTVFAATPAGLFQLEEGTNYWQAALRPLTLSSPNLKIKIAESSRDEIQAGDPSFKKYNRWVTINADSISIDNNVVLTLHPSQEYIYSHTDTFTVIDTTVSPPDTTFYPWTADYPLSMGEDSISQWVLEPIEGILGDEGKFFLDISLATALTMYNVNAQYRDYDLIKLSDFSYLGNDNTATIINPRTEVLLIAEDSTDPNYEIGGQYVTVVYDNGSEFYKWSVRASSLREPNKDKKGLLISNGNKIAGGTPDYQLLNQVDQLHYFSASTINSEYNFTQLRSSVDGAILYGVTSTGIFISSDGGSTWTQKGNNLNETVFDILPNDNVYLGTSSGVHYFDNANNRWELFPYLLSYTPIPVRTLAQVNGTLTVGGDFGYFNFSTDDSSWSSDNIQLYGYMADFELDTLKDMVDSTTAAKPDSGIYNILTGRFGLDHLPDIDNNDTLTILLHNIHDISEPWNNTSNGSEGGIDQIVGYIRFDDQSLVGRTNRREVIYLDTRGGNVEDSLSLRINDRGSAFAHQLMRLMMLKSDFDEERWIIEGIASFGEKLCGFRLPSAWLSFPASSGTSAGAIPLVVGTPLIPWQVNPDGGSAMEEHFTKAAMWMTYLYENLGGLELDFIKTLMDEPANGIAGIETILPDFMPAGVSELSFGDVFSAWSIANTINDTNLVDPVSGMRYGYLDSNYNAMVNNYKYGNVDSAGVKLQMLQQAQGNMSDYENIQLPDAYSDGLNNWATVHGKFMPAMGTGLAIWAGKEYHINGDDEKTFRLWIIKHKTGGGYTIRDFTDSLNSENEVSFEICKEFEPTNVNLDSLAFYINKFGDDPDSLTYYYIHPDSIEYEYYQIDVGISNQTPLGGSARYVQTIDVTPPALDVSVVHNSFYPEFLSIYVFTSEHLHADVNQAESPVVLVADSASLDTNAIAMTLFQDLADTAGYTGSLYRGELQLEQDDTLDLLLDKVQDLAGNDTSFSAMPISVRKISNLDKQVKLNSGDHRLVVSFPSQAFSEKGFLTLISESPAMYSKLHGIDQSAYGEVAGLYSIGPTGLSLAKEACISFDLGESDFKENLGFYVIEGNQLLPIPAVYSSSSSSLSAAINQLGTFLIASNARTAADVVLAPETYALEQNYPNPFNPNTTIRYRLASPGKTTIFIYDLLGKEVKTLVGSFQTPGHYEAHWNGLDNYGQQVGSGVYFYRISVESPKDPLDLGQSGDFNKTKKMLLVK